MHTQTHTQLHTQPRKMPIFTNLNSLQNTKTACTLFKSVFKPFKCRYINVLAV